MSNGRTYYYQVSAVNSAGESSRSNEISVTPQGSPAEDSRLEKVTVYPNPYIKGKSSSEKIIFANLPKEAAVKIYLPAGELIRELSANADGLAEWNLREVQSGIYLYAVISPEGVKKGKVSVLR